MTIIRTGLSVEFSVRGLLFVPLQNLFDRGLGQIQTSRYLGVRVAVVQDLTLSSRLPRVAFRLRQRSEQARFQIAIQAPFRETIRSGTSTVCENGKSAITDP